MTWAPWIWSWLILRTQTLLRLHRFLDYLDLAWDFFLLHLREGFLIMFD